MPRAIITGVILTIVVYLFVNVGFLCALTVEDIKSSSLIAETFAFQLAGIRIISIWILHLKQGKYYKELTTNSGTE